VYCPGLDHGVARIREPVESLADVEFSYWSPAGIACSDRRVGLQACLNHFGIYVIGEMVNAVRIYLETHVQETLRPTEHHQADIQRFPPIDIGYQA